MSSLRLSILAALIASVLPLGVPAAEAAPSGRFDCLALYDAGDYGAAVGCFESLEAGGAHNGHLLYNLGNAQYRSGDPARALLAYRRASLYLPRDGDLKANLASARDQIQDDLDPPDVRSPLMSTLLAPYDALSQKELLITGAVAWILLIGVLGLRLRQRFGYARLSGALLGSVALFGLVGGAARSYQTENQPIAVVLTEEATVRSGRDVRSTDLVRLHAGAEVGILEVGEEWMQVGLSNGTRGWLPANALGLVRPLPRN